MILNLGSLSFNADIQSGGGTPAWGTELGQGTGYKFSFEDMTDFFTGMVYSSVSNINDVTCPLGKGGNQQSDYDFVIASHFKKIFVNGLRVDNAEFILLIVKKLVGEHHVGRRTIKYNPKMTYKGREINDACYKLVIQTLGFQSDASWFINEINIKNQDELHFVAYVLGDRHISYSSTEERKQAYLSKVPNSNKGQELYVTDSLFKGHSLQQIFYGAPGTGKSHKVKEVTDKLPKSDVFRTTFHPDSDYSTFVGCYKPKMVKAPIRDSSGHEITSACEDEKKRIAYEYEPQAFLKAYIRSYETSEPVFLIIEEINRGNCAQIFGDMFQLLDRNEKGESDYSIKPETAIQEFLYDKLKDFDIADEAIKSGEEMRLPNNLYIWATMNTSDQSLFPVDSAFKRRWDWQYMPICKGRDENGNELNWKIAADTKEYDWWSFLTKINDHINSTTNSEDKKLGFFFCKPQDGCISSETFVGKVIFYLWNDVFKDFGFEGPIFKDSDGSELSFNKFYKTDDKGKAVVQKDKIELFLNNLGVDVVKDNLDSTEEREEDEDGNDISSPSTGRDYTKFSINGVGSYGKNNLAAECVKKYIELNPEKTADEVLSEWISLGNIVPHFIESKKQFDARTDNSKRSHEIPCGDTVLYVAHNGYGNNGKVQALIDAVNKQNWNITLSEA